MPRATNRQDGTRVYLEDEGGDGAPVVLYGGFLDSVADLRKSGVARALPRAEFRSIYAADRRARARARALARDRRPAALHLADSPLTRLVTEALGAGRAETSMEPLVRAFEDFWAVSLPDPLRARWLANDPVALHAAWSAALAEDAISEDLARWRPRCLIFIGAADADFLAGARRAASEIPDAELLVVEEADHYAAHMSQDEVVLDAVIRTLRGGG